MKSLEKAGSHVADGNAWHLAGQRSDADWGLQGRASFQCPDSRERQYVSDTWFLDLGPTLSALRWQQTLLLSSSSATQH
jgi:hypothetical protein